MLKVLQKRYTSNENLILTQNKEGDFVSEPIKELDVIQNMYISSRGSGGIAEELIIETKKNVSKVVTEHNIRYILNVGISKVNRQDGSSVASPNLLPSAFFTLEIAKEGKSIVGYSLIGGGYGHGVGMSQNGAKEMAKEGYKATDILQFFYEGCNIIKIYEEGIG